jgi:hypothetical protein
MELHKVMWERSTAYHRGSRARDVLQGPVLLHVSKTGGMSVTHYLLEALRATDLPHAPAEHRLTLFGEGVLDVPGPSHKTLAEARGAIAAFGSRSQFPRIVTTIRTVRDEVSPYTHPEAEFAG